MNNICIRPICLSDKATVEDLLREHWGDCKVVSRGKVYDAAVLPGFVALDGGSFVGLVTLHMEGGACEVVTLDAYMQGKGIGSALMRAAEEFAVARNCRRLWLITSNDNVGALLFYQKLGFRIVAVHLDAIDEARKIKPQIPHVAENGIPIRDEIELVKPLG
jgi:ribosomal protein S18 acetylase RimI-like enzyme